MIFSSETRASRERQIDVASSKTCYHNAHSNPSVLKSDSGKDFDLGKQSFDYIGTFSYSIHF